jgi:hypothetical protein
MTILIGYVLPIVLGAALAALLARWVIRKTTRRDGASSADPLLAFYDLHRRARESGDTVEQDAALVAGALAAAARRLAVPGIAGTCRTWLASPDLDRPRRLLAHHGTEEACAHARILADLVEHPQREEITERIEAALGRAEAPSKPRPRR